MDRIAEFTEIVENLVAEYANVRTWGGRSYFVADPERCIYTVLVIHDTPRPFPTRVDIVARVLNETVVIEEDTTDRPLYEALMRAGIPREKIVLSYAGEKLPE